MNQVFKYAGDFMSLFFPDTCCGCGRSLSGGEQTVCTACLYELPFTNFHLYPDNPVARQFWGRIPLVYAGACLFFLQQSKVQRIIHQLKYNNRPEAGVWLGQVYGRQICSLAHDMHTDLIVPVPLYKSREKKRGYNQSGCIARGLSEITGIPVDNTSLVRTGFAASQTGKNRFSRYENTREVFRLENPAAFEGRHVLLVDDVITTGATAEACCAAMLGAERIKLSVVSIAYAK